MPFTCALQREFESILLRVCRKKKPKVLLFKAVLWAKSTY